MSEERFDRIENMMTQLIQMVAENNKAIARMEQRLDKIEQRLDNLEQRMDKIEQRMDKLEQRMDNLEQQFSSERNHNEERHKEMLKEIRNMSFEIDYLHKQSAKHDLEIHVLKESRS